MGLFLLILTIILFLVSINKINKKIYNKNIRQYKEKLKTYRKKLIIFGILSIIFISLFNVVLIINDNSESTDKLNSTLPFIYILLLAYMIVMFSFIVHWILVPSKEKIKREIEQERINKELEKFNFDKKIKYNSNIICFDNNNRVLAIINTYKNTCELIRYEEIINCEIYENEKDITNKQNGTIIGVGSRKGKELIDLKLKIITNNSNKKIYMLSIKDSEIEKEAIEFLNESYINIMEIMNDFGKYN